MRIFVRLIYYFRKEMSNTPFFFCGKQFQGSPITGETEREKQLSN